MTSRKTLKQKNKMDEDNKRKGVAINKKKRQNFSRGNNKILQGDHKRERTTKGESDGIDENCCRNEKRTH